ncbi:MAG: nitrilase-related carbon-nitrogen hydrolase, partial [Thermodesulfobacteriota bacterium]|nr:nitrilase-related carbon-nitrogen hydrolase [Thermodesulfobacteriota bacterium]
MLKKNQFAAFGYFRLAVASPAHRVADIDYNMYQIEMLLDEAMQQGCQCLVLPELAITGYTCGDLFFQSLLIERTEQALQQLAQLSATASVLLVVGAPIAQGGRLFNCAVVIGEGKILGIVPKNFLPNTQEFYEERWFSAADDRTADEVLIDDQLIPFGNDLLFQNRDMPDCLIGIEICEDGWVANPPSGHMAVAGATVLLNLSASPELLGKQEYRQQLVRSQSARCLAVYAYSSAGAGESSTDLVFSGHSLIAENGVMLVATERFSFDTRWVCADVDIDRLMSERRKNNNFAASHSARYPDVAYRVVEFSVPFSVIDPKYSALKRKFDRQPFVPAGIAERSQRCKEIFALQTTALARRLKHIGTKSVVIGISGGLDSTLALLVAVKVFDLLKLDRCGI